MNGSINVICLTGNIYNSLMGQTITEFINKTLKHFNSALGFLV
jgi:hypothetical protein